MVHYGRDIGTKRDHRGKAFQAEEIASAKALGSTWQV